jgi:hypothetical protein
MLNGVDSQLVKQLTHHSTRRIGIVMNMKRLHAPTLLLEALRGIGRVNDGNSARKEGSRRHPSHTPAP